MIISLIFAGLLLIDMIVYLVASIKNKAIPEKISLFTLLPLTYGITIPFFKACLPDSLNIMIYTSVAVFFAALVPVLNNLKIKKNSRLEKISYLLSLFSWFILYQSSFYLYRVPAFIPVIILILFLATAVFFLFKLHIKNLYEALKFIIILAAAFTIVLVNFTTLLYSKNLSGSLCFSGAVLLTVFAVLRKINEKKPLKFLAILSNLLLFFGTSLVSASAVLLQI